MTGSATGADGETKSPSQCHNGRRWDDHGGEHTPEWLPPQRPMGLVRFGNAGPNSSTRWQCRARGAKPIPAGGATDGMHIQPTRPSQQTEAEGKTRIKEMVKSARELQDAELEAKTRAAFLRAQGPNNEARPVGVSMDSALAGHGWVKASLLRDHQALATAQDKIAATQTLLREAAQRAEMARIAAATEPLNPDDMETQQFPPNLAALLAVCVQAKRNMAVDASAGTEWIAKLISGLRAAASRSSSSGVASVSAFINNWLWHTSFRTAATTATAGERTTRGHGLRRGCCGGREIAAGVQSRAPVQAHARRVARCRARCGFRPTRLAREIFLARSKDDHHRIRRLPAGPSHANCVGPANPRANPRASNHRQMTCESLRLFCRVANIVQ